jgi:hypothetical protein
MGGATLGGIEGVGFRDEQKQEKKINHANTMLTTLHQRHTQKLQLKIEDGDFTYSSTSTIRIYLSFY